MSRGLGLLQKRVLGAMVESQKQVVTLRRIKCALWGDPELFYDAFGERHKTYGAHWRNANEHHNVKRALLGLVQRGLVRELFMGRFMLTDAGRDRSATIATHLPTRDDRPKPTISREVYAAIWKQ